MFKALSEGHRKFRRVAVVADTVAPTPPCGACRQILWEFGGDLEVILANLRRETGRHQLKDSAAAAIRCASPLERAVRRGDGSNETFVPSDRTFAPRTVAPSDRTRARNRLISSRQMLPTIEWKDDAVVMIDQRKLPASEVYVSCKTAKEVAKAITTMVIRGAPAIGVAAAMGIALGMKRSSATGTKQFTTEFQKICDLMAATRPTAVNLFWAIERMKRTFAAAAQGGASVDELKQRLEAEAHEDSRRGR